MTSHLPALRANTRQVYDLARTKGQWDLVLFMGVFYHLRYPLLGLDIVAEKVGRYLVFQSVTTGEAGELASPEDVNFQTLDELERPRYADQGLRYADDLLHHKGRVGPQHHHLAMGHVDDAHDTEGDREPDRREQQNRAK